MDNCTKFHIQDSVPNYLQNRAIIPCTGTVVKSCRNGIKQLSSSNELDAQNFSPHQKPKRPHLQEKDMPVAFCRECHVELQMRKLQRKKVSGSSKWLHSIEMHSLGA